ncbi:MAG: permease prefix domain 1-containing protein [Paraclostridium sp.]
MEVINRYVTINNYIDSLYKNDKRIEVLELKEELSEHLILSAEEFVEQGYDEEEASKKAIEKFDGGTEMLDELHKTLKKNKSKSYTLAKLFRNITIGSFILALLSFGYLYMTENYYTSINNHIKTDFTKLASNHDMTNIDEYKEDLRLLLEKKEYKNVNNVEVFVADMEEGNKNTNVDKMLSKLVYQIVDPKMNPGMRAASSSMGLGANGILDKHGNVVDPQVYVDATVANFVFDNQVYILFAPVIAFVIYCGFKIKFIKERKQYV